MTNHPGFDIHLLQNDERIFTRKWHPPEALTGTRKK